MSLFNTPFFLFCSNRWIVPLMKKREKSPVHTVASAFSENSGKRDSRHLPGAGVIIRTSLTDMNKTRYAH